MSELKVPYALDELDRLCSPVEAEKGKPYRCPACKQPVILKKGQIKKPHFAHKADNNCNQETIIHQTAKILIKRAVDEWKSGTGKAPVLERLCEICMFPATQPLPDKVEGAILEQRLADGSIADVALLTNGKPVVAVEIRVTHAVDDNKAARLSIPFIELEGLAVIENPYVWKSIKDSFKPFTCEKCRDAFKKFKIEAKKIANQTNIQLPKSYYRYGITNCWRCNRKIIVFTWVDGSMFPREKPSVEPIPRTIQYKYSKEAESKYWVNTCPYCKVLQGSFYLHMESEGPFFGTNLEYTPESFEKDLQRIASKATNYETI